MKKTVFVTVGTTKFPKLINTLLTRQVVKKLIELQYQYIQVQTGNDFSKANLKIDFEEVVWNETNTNVKINDKIEFNFTPYFENFSNEIRKSDLVISHAGSGTCLEVLRLQKPLIVVVNEDLMDNHQLELAEQLQKDEHLFYGTCESLSDVLNEDFSKLKPYPQRDTKIFSSYLNKCMGFV